MVNHNIFKKILMSIVENVLQLRSLKLFKELKKDRNQTIKLTNITQEQITVNRRNLALVNRK